MALGRGLGLGLRHPHFGGGGGAETFRYELEDGSGLYLMESGSYYLLENAP